MKEISYDTKMVCSHKITICIEKDIVKKVEFHKGCDGNLQAIGKLVEGMHVSEVIKRLKGIQCGTKGTSCPDQLVNALESYMNKEA